MWETKITFRWLIKHFSLQCQNIRSADFSSLEPSDGEWHLVCQFSPNDRSDYIFVGLNKTSSSDDIMAKCHIYLTDQQGTEFKTFTLNPVTFTNQSSGWGFTIEKEEIINKIQPHGNILVVLCKIQIFQESTWEIESKLKSCQLSCLNSFQALMEDDHFTDVVINTSDGKELKAHKNILAARSSVFAAMFRNEMSESRTSEVSIPDIDEKQMKLMLTFVYGGTLIKEELTMADKNKLLASAHKYNIETLQSLMEEYLIEDINISNAVGLLINAYLYQCDKLKRCLIKFMCSHEVKSLLGTPEWQYMVSNYPHLIDECFQHLLLSKDHGYCVSG